MRSPNHGVVGTAMIVVVIVAACTLAPTVECPEVQPEPELTCDAAIAAARARIFGVGGVTALSFHYGIPCPPGASCPFTDQGGFVIASRVGAEPLMVRVTFEDGVVRADEPEPSTIGP